MAKAPFMLHAKPLPIRLLRFVYRWWQLGRHARQLSVSQRILWQDALLEAGFARAVLKNIEQLAEQSVTRHQRYQMHIIQACAQQSIQQPRLGIESLQEAALLARTISQKAEVLQREGKCRVDLCHWQRAHWCFEHAFLLRQEIGSIQAMQRSASALDRLSIMRQQNLQGFVVKSH